jgi:hypothetical protein
MKTDTITKATFTTWHRENGRCGWYVSPSRRLPDLAISSAHLNHTTYQGYNGVTYDYYEVEIGVQSPTGDSSDYYTHTYPVDDLAGGMALLRALYTRTVSLLTSFGVECVEE